MRLISQAVADGFITTRPEDRVCRSCGCTEVDCSGCIQRTGLRCQWVEADLCSACAPLDTTDPLYPVRINEATGFIWRLSALDVTSVALSARHGAEESDVAFVVDAYFALRRGLAPHRNPRYQPPRLSVAGGILANVMQAFMGQPNIQIAQKTLTNLSTNSALLQGALSGPTMAPFVYQAVNQTVNENMTSQKTQPQPQPLSKETR